MTHHLSTSELEQFCVSALAEDELAAAASHTAGCDACHQRFVEELRGQRGAGPFSFTLEPEFWFRNDHLDFELLVGLADHTLDHDLKEIIEVHLKTCEVCSEDGEGKEDGTMATLFIHSQRDVSKSMLHIKAIGFGHPMKTEKYITS